MTKGIKGCKNLRHGGLIWQDVTPDRGRWPTLQTLISAIFGEKKRLTKLAAAMAESPGKSLPQQCGRWADLKAAYRLLSHPAVTPEQITATHRQRTRRGAQVLPIVLSVQDTTDLDYTHRTAVRGLGKLGDGRGRGFRQHTALAVSGEGQVLGMLEQRWFLCSNPPERETRRQRQARWTEPDIWGETAEGIGRWPSSSRLIHVGDRHSDVFRFLCTCGDQGHGFLVRAMHDRYLADTDQSLWERLHLQPSAGHQTVHLGSQRTKNNHPKRDGRNAEVTIRYAPVLIPPPRNDPRTAGQLPIRAWAIYAKEERPPQVQSPVEWMLLTSEPIDTVADARRYLQWYGYRWRIEEWHRALKEGCRLERSQLDDIEDLKRLAALSGVLAIRLLQLRDLAREDSRQAHNPKTLQEFAPRLWIEVVARLAQVSPDALTPKQFLWTLARRGGFLARKSDGMPGWKTLWQGWQEVAKMVEGIELMKPPPTCG